MSVPLKAAAAFHYFGQAYAEGDTIDISGLTEHARRQLMTDYPVYFDVAGLSNPGSAVYDITSTGGGVPSGGQNLSLSLSSGDELLDLVTSGADVPRAIADGVYAVALRADLPVVSGKTFHLELDLGPAPTIINQVDMSPLNNCVSVAGTFFVPANGVIDAWCWHDAAAPIAVSGKMYLQKLS